MLLARAASRFKNAFKSVTVLLVRFGFRRLFRRLSRRLSLVPSVSLKRSVGTLLEALARTPATLATACMSLFFLLPFYPWERRSAAPALLPGAPRGGDRHKGKEVLQGICDWGGVRILQPYPFWQPASASARWLETCHGFVWLDDVRAYAAIAPDTEQKLQAVRFAAERIEDWLLCHRRWSWEAWQPTTVAKRLTQWLQHYDWYAPALGLEQRLSLHRALYAHYRHLCRATRLLPRFSFERLTGLLVCTTASLCFRESRARRQACERRLCRCLEEQVPRGEGFWHGRKASRQQAVMEALLQVKRLYALVQLLPPEGLLAALDRMVPALMMLRSGDGALATFNGSREGSAAAVARLLAGVQVRARTPLSATGAGLERMVAQKALVLVDTSYLRPSRPSPSRAQLKIGAREGFKGGGEPPYASTSAFEFSYEQDRIIVSCALEAAESAHLPAHLSLRAARSSAAHSMLTIAERNVCSLHPFDTRRARVRVARSQQEGHTRLSLSHDGYKSLFGLVVSREWQLSPVGTRLWGWERIHIANARRFEDRRDKIFKKGFKKRFDKGLDKDLDKGLPFALRFHLHPKVSVFLVRNGREAVLKPENRPGFRFRIQGAASLSLAESLYGGEGKLKPTKQLLVSGSIERAHPDDSLADDSLADNPAGDTFLLAWHLQHETDEEA